MRRVRLFALTVAVLLMSSSAGHAAEIYYCQNNTCLCLTWTVGATGYIEIRCGGGSSTGGWASGPGLPGDGSNGSWQGSGTPRNPPSPLPGNILSPAANQAVTSAKNAAMEKVRGEKVPDMKGVWEPTRCTDLFGHNPLGRTGASILGSYVVFRDGTGVKDANNVDVCGTGTVAAWTQCCRHEPVVFICPSKFMGLPADDKMMKLIHEAMHVAGQTEDTDGSVGPSDPPNPGQIDDAVRKACGL